MNAVKTADGEDKDNLKLMFFLVPKETVVPKILGTDVSEVEPSKNKSSIYTRDDRAKETDADSVRRR